MKKSFKIYIAKQTGFATNSEPEGCDLCYGFFNGGKKWQI